MSKLVDRTPFWGSRTVPELKYLQSVLNDKVQGVSLSRSVFRKFLKLIIESCMSQNMKQESHYELFKLLAKEFTIPVDHVVKIHASILKLFQLSMRHSSLKQEVLKQDLREILNYPQDYVNDFSSAVYSHLREDIETVMLVSSSPRLAQLASVNWRIDVSISTSSMSRHLQPSVILQLVLTDGRLFSFELSLTHFHMLRFDVALVLKEMDDLLNRPTLRLLD